MLDSRRTWLRRIGTVGGVGLVLLGLYIALLRNAFTCPPSTSHHQLACDPGPPSHPHVVAGLVVGLTGLAVLIALRRLVAYFDDE